MTTTALTRTASTLALPTGAAACLALATLLGHHALDLARLLSPATGPDSYVVLAVCALGAALAAWYSLHLLLGAACALGAAAGRRWRAGEQLLAAHGPALVRRGVALALGTSLGLGGIAAASASSPVPDLGWVPTDGVVEIVETTTEAEPRTPPTAEPDEAPTPTRAAPDLAAPEPSTPEPSTPAPQPSTPAPSPEEDPAGSPGTVRTVQVEAGDSLWSITSQLLDQPTDAEVAAAWPLLYEANRDVVGADPDLIHPGQQLTVPTALEELS